MQMLQGVHSGLVPLSGGNSLDRGLGCGDGGNCRNSREDRGPPDRLLIEKRVLSAWRVDDQLNSIALDQVYDIGPALFHLENPLNDEARLLKHIRRALGSHDLESKMHIASSELNCRIFVVIIHAEEHCTDRRQHLPSRKLRLGKGLAKGG